MIVSIEERIQQIEVGARVRTFSGITGTVGTLIGADQARVDLDVPDELGGLSDTCLLDDLQLSETQSHPYIAYVQKLFKPGDRVCIMWIHATREWKPGFAETKSFFQSLEQTLAEDVSPQLATAQRDGWNLYVCMNPIVPGATNRTKDDIGALRSVYCEVDQNGPETREEIRRAVAAGEIPPPHFINESSPLKFQFVWCVKGFETIEQQEQMCKSLQRRFKTDAACVDACRILRLPGFLNLKPKYGPKFPVSKVVEQNLSASRYRPEDFKIALADLDESDKGSIVAEKLGSEEIQKAVDFVLAALDESGALHDGTKERLSGAVDIPLRECPWGDDHSDGKRGDAGVLVGSDGTLGFHCFHAHCADRHWAEFRAELEARAGRKLQFGENGLESVIVNRESVSPEEYKQFVEEQRRDKMETASSPPLSSSSDEQPTIVLTDAADNLSALDLTAEEEVPPYNEKLIRGFFADAVDLIAGGTTMPVQFPHVIAKTFLGLRLAVQGVRFENCDAEPRLYNLNIGDTGTSKGWSMKRARELFTCFGKESADDQNYQRIKLWDGTDSGAGLKESFFDYPDEAGVLLYIDETMELGSKSRSDRSPEIFTTLLTLADGTSIGRNKARKEDRKKKNDARLSMIMCVQPKILPLVFAGNKTGDVGFFDRITPEFSSPIRPGSTPSMQDRRAEIEKFYSRFVSLDFSNIHIAQGGDANIRIEDYWNSLPADEQTKLRRKKNIYIDHFVIRASLMAACKDGLKNFEETSQQDADDAIENDIRQATIRRIYFKDQISDEVGAYISKLKNIVERQQAAIHKGTPPERIALSYRDFASATNAYRDNELHKLAQAWRVFQPTYLIALQGQQNTLGRKTAKYIPRIA